MPLFLKNTREEVEREKEGRERVRERGREGGEGKEERGRD